MSYEICFTLQDAALFGVARLRADLAEPHHDPHGDIPRQTRECSQLYDDNSGDVRILEYCLRYALWSAFSRDRDGEAQGVFDRYAQ